MAMQGQQEKDLIDKGVLTRFQNHFCSAHRVYLKCVDAQGEELTPFSGSDAETDFFKSYIGTEAVAALIARAGYDTPEHVQEAKTGFDWLRLYTVAASANNRVQIIWVVIAVVKELVPEKNDLPDSLLTTTEEHLFGTMEFLEYQSRMMMAARIDELIAQDAVQQSAASEEHMKQELKRSEAMTQIVTMLESENGFSKIADDILRMVCTCLDISAGSLIRANTEAKTADMICEYAREKEWYQIADFQQVPIEQIPFFTDKSYMISSDSICPAPFAEFFRKYHITAGIYQPIEMNDKVVMYLCFYEIDKTRTWSVGDIKFINDVRRIVQSILTKRVAKNSLASSYESLEAILENVGCGIYVADPQRRTILYTNQKFKELYANTIAAGKIEQLLFSEKELRNERFFDEVYSPEEERWLDVHKTVINWVDGRKVSLCTIYDITDKKLYQKKIESQANNDFLTGLYNRMRCENDLDQYIHTAQKANAEGALLYIDLDDFKHINDGLGHQYGDVLLKAISHSLQRIPGIESNCYRMGGDEFVIILTDTKKYDINAICGQIQNVFAKPWFLKGEDYYCTMSMGIVCFPTDGDSVEDLIRKADMALFSAKNEGKNRIEYYNGKDAAMAHRRLDMEKNMRKATMDACKEFEVYYQPIVDITKEGNPCCGAEALIRWNSTEMGFISPADFIPLAEYLGLINPIGDYVLEQAAIRCRHWNEMGHPEYKVNVNLSVVQLLQNDIVKKVARVIADTHVNPKNLTLEVTESLAVNDMERMKKILGQLKELGVRVALDDFGTGYSSLNHIREMPIDVIKIDRCFIEHIDEDDFSDAFVKMVAELAMTLGVSICTEGVENTKQYEKIKQLNIAMIQGYYFNKPMRVEEFEDKYL